MRTQKTLQEQPCKYKISEQKIISGNNETKIVKVEKTRPKTDENGNIIYEEKKVPIIKKGCGCKKRNADGSIQYKIEKVPVMETYIEEVEQTQDTTQSTFLQCKLYGKVRSEFCTRCSTYKPL